MTKMWTQAEIDALPDVSIRFGMREQLIDGKIRCCPVVDEGAYTGVFYRKDTDPQGIVDAIGVRWEIGRMTPDGPLCKRRSYGG